MSVQHQTPPPVPPKNDDTNVSAEKKDVRPYIAIGLGIVSFVSIILVFIAEGSFILSLVCSVAGIVLAGLSFKRLPLHVVSLLVPILSLICTIVAGLIYLIFASSILYQVSNSLDGGEYYPYNDHEYRYEFRYEFD